jgi:hypothetical protein
MRAVPAIRLSSHRNNIGPGELTEAKLSVDIFAAGLPLRLRHDLLTAPAVVAPLSPASFLAHPAVSASPSWSRYRGCTPAHAIATRYPSHRLSLRQSWPSHPTLTMLAPCQPRLPMVDSNEIPSASTCPPYRTRVVLCSSLPSDLLISSTLRMASSLPPPA